MNVFPDLPGLTWPVTRRHIFRTVGSESISGRFYGATYWEFPLYEFDLRFDYLLAGDFDLLVGLFLTSHGDQLPFWFDAGAGDNSVDEQAIGVGDGAETVFELLRSTGTFVQPVDASFGARTAYVDGSPVAATWQDTTVTYTVAPAAATALAWSGNYYYQCRFKETEIDLDELVELLHQNALTIRSSR